MSYIIIDIEDDMPVDFTSRIFKKRSEAETVLAHHMIDLATLNCETAEEFREAMKPFRNHSDADIANTTDYFEIVEL